VTAHSKPEAALVAYRQTPGSFDLAIAAAQMPGMSGLELAAEMLEERPNARIIVAGGSRTQELSDAAARLGVILADEPGAPDALAAAVRRALDSTKEHPS
jgi:DNA-binding NarL/FixJ family response regulator